MVSIISQWLQKRMPSYEMIQSKLAKEDVENNKDIVVSLKINIFLFIISLFFIYFFISIREYLAGGALVLSSIISAVSICLSIVLSRQYRILKYKISMLMTMLSGDSLALVIVVLMLKSTENLLLDIILIFVIFFCFEKIIINNKVMSTKYEKILNIGCFISLLTGIWEFFFGEGNIEQFIKSVFVVVFLSLIYKVAKNLLSEHYKTLFYLLTYPEEFRKKFGYSIKEWYGIHSPQYKAEKKSQR